MKLSFKIILGVCILGLAGLLYWGYPFAKERYFPKEKELQIENKPETSEPAIESENGDILDLENETPDTPPEESATADDTTDEEAKPAPVEEDEPFVSVTQKDCENKCENFTDKDDLKYCRETCGLAEKKSPEKVSDCADLEGLEIDYCWKDFAISEKDLKICGRISDAGIKKTCQNRVTEDLVDEQKQELE